MSAEIDESIAFYLRVAGAIDQLDPDRRWSIQGLGSLALLEMRLSGASSDPTWTTKARNTVGEAFRLCVSSESLMIGLYSGLMGLGWCVQLVNRLLPEKQRLELSDVDDAALDYLSSPRHDGNFDMINGAVGCIVYALDHPDIGFRAQASQRFLTLFESNHVIRERLASPQAALPPRPDENPRDRSVLFAFNDGLAHGLPGALAALARIALSEHKDPRLLPLLRGTLDCCLADIRVDVDRSRNYVPYTQWDEGPSRCAWCYGEPGLASAVCAAGAALGDASLQRLAVDLFCDSVDRSEPAERHLNNIGICHGWAGIYLTAIYLAKLTGHADARLKRIADEARCQVMAALDKAAESNVLPVVNPNEPDGQLVFLTGVLGLAHVRLDFARADVGARDVDLPWTSCLLL